MTGWENTTAGIRVWYTDISERNISVKVVLKGLKLLKVPPRLRDHLRNMILGRIKCGSYCNKIRGHESRASALYGRKENLSKS